jgi:hypothetical protein
LNEHASGGEVPVLLSLMLGVFPFLAGAMLGSRRTQKPLQGLLLSQLLLYAPITVTFFLLTSSSGATGQLGAAMFTAVYTAASTVAGGAGVQAGSWLSKLRSKRRRKS